MFPAVECREQPYLTVFDGTSSDKSSDKIGDKTSLFCSRLVRFLRLSENTAIDGQPLKG